MIDLEEEVRDHAHNTLGILINYFEQHTPLTDVESILRDRSARKILREYLKRFSSVMQDVDEQELVLRIMPYEGPGNHHGEPAYDMDGVQLLVEVVDNYSENEFRNICHRALSWDDDVPDVARKNKKIRALYASVSKIKAGKAEKPVPVAER